MSTRRRGSRGDCIHLEWTSAHLFLKGSQPTRACFTHLTVEHQSRTNYRFGGEILPPRITVRSRRKCNCWIARFTHRIARLPARCCGTSNPTPETCLQKLRRGSQQFCPSTHTHPNCVGLRSGRVTR